MPPETLLAAHKPPLRTPNAPESMPGTAKPQRFIGAVEDEWELFSDRAEDYTIGEPIGFGASSIVYAATYHPSGKAPSPCALKVLDLDSLPPRSLQLLQRETTLMSLSKHPNVLRVRGSWMDGHKLCIALRLMNKGSAADVMRYGWPGGMEEDVVRCILRQALQGLNYLHINGFIHRDIKAANLLIDDDGTVLLGDLGVAADLTEDTSAVTTHSKFSITSPTSMAHFKSSAASTHSNGSGGKRGVVFDEAVQSVARPRIGKRKSFVGTPCWMAPELIQGKQYDSKADIWSFGITALELTQGRPPRSREPPQRVLLKTIQEAPPSLDREGGAFKYSRAFKEVVDWCLNKDPSKRPTAEELLETPFFKGGKKKSYLINTILKNLPPLTQRQERRALPLIKSASSVDSWDFANTIHSPVVAHRKRFSGLSDDHDHEETIEGVFMMEEEHRTYHSGSASHSRTVSWIEPEPMPSVDVEAEHTPTLPQDPESEIDVEAPAPPSPSTSASSLPSSGIDDSPSSIPDTSAPSSYTDASELASRSQSTRSLTTEPRNTTEPLASIAEHSTQSTVISARKQHTLNHSASVPRKLSSSSRASSSPGSAFVTGSESLGKRNLWQKIKTNVKGTSSSLGSTSSSLSDKDTQLASDASQKKGRMSGMFSGSNKGGLLTRSSSNRS